MWRDELTILAAPLRNPAVFAELRELLRDEMFEEPEVARAWCAMKVSQDRGHGLNFEAVCFELAGDEGALRALELLACGRGRQEQSADERENSVLPVHDDLLS